MNDKHKAYRLAIQLHQELMVRQDQYPEIKTAVGLADELAREMGWQWVKSR